MHIRIPDVVHRLLQTWDSIILILELGNPVVIENQVHVTLVPLRGTSVVTIPAKSFSN